MAWLANPRAPFSTSPLEGGGRQWNFQGRPLYRYARDKDPRDIRGQGVEGGWSAVILEPPPALPPWVTLTRVDIGWVFADARGMTVYAPARCGHDRQGQDLHAGLHGPVLEAGEGGADGRRRRDAGASSSTRTVSVSGPMRDACSTRTPATQRPGEMQGNSFAVGYSIGDGFRVILVDSTLPAPGS